MFTNKLTRISFIFGLYGSLATILYFLFLYLFGYDPLDKKLIFLKYFFLIFFIIAGIKIYKDKLNNNTLRLWEGLLCGLIINLTIALLSAIFVYLFLTFIDGEVLSRHIEELVKFAESQKQQMLSMMSEETFNKFISKQYATSVFVIALDDFGMYFIGIPFIIIIAVLLRK